MPEGFESKELGTVTNVTVKDGTVTWTAADNADHKTVDGTTYHGAKVTAAKATYTVSVEEHEIAVVAYNAADSEKTVSTVVTVVAKGATKYQVAKVVNGRTVGAWDSNYGYILIFHSTI